MSRNSPLLAFAPEWAAVSAVALLDVPLVAQAGIRFTVTSHDGNFVIPILFALSLAARRLGWRRAGLTLEFLALMMGAALALAVLTYACSALSGPWMDAPLRAGDLALGFNWLAWFHFVTGNPVLGPGLRLLYFSLGGQALYFAVLRGLMDDAVRPRETFWILFTGCLITAVGCWAAPALGPYDTYHLKDTYGQFVLELEKLRAHHDMHFPLGRLQGVVDFPSFHSTMAVALAWAFRKTGIIGWTIAAADIVLLAAVPVYGGHYLMDVFAGVAVFVVSVVLVRAVRARMARDANLTAMPALAQQAG